MFPAALDADARAAVMAFSSAVADARWTPLGNAGGFSGSRVWHGLAAGSVAFCLKAFPPRRPVAWLLERIIHPWMRAAIEAGLAFVPAIESTRTGRTVAEVGGRVWEVTAWMPGRADFHANPTSAKLAAAVTAVAGIHEAWARIRGRAMDHAVGPCPAIGRRWRAIADWEHLTGRKGWRPQFADPHDPVRPHAEAAWGLLPVAIRRARDDLSPWLGRTVNAHPCLCDVWHDHILYDGDRVTGVIDFGAAKVDHPAVDLARLLGSLIPDDAIRMSEALDVYRTIRPLPEPELVPLLDRTGVVVAVTNWLRWLYEARREYADRAAIAERMAGLVRRLAATTSYEPRGL